MFGAAANCEYVWNSVSVYSSMLALDWGGCAVQFTYLLLESPRLLAHLRPSCAGRRHSTKKDLDGERPRDL